MNYINRILNYIKEIENDKNEIDNDTIKQYNKLYQILSK